MTTKFLCVMSSSPKRVGDDRFLTDSTVETFLPVDKIYEFYGISPHEVCAMGLGRLGDAKDQWTCIEIVAGGSIRRYFCNHTPEQVAMAIHLLNTTPGRSICLPDDPTDTSREQGIMP